MAIILVVDDRQANREFLVTLLGYSGHRLLEALDGEEGLSIARAEHPDLIISDIVMPKMDGYEFARQIRSDPSIEKTQIIFYTSSYVLEETRRLAEACGVSLVLGKPIEPEKFLEVVQVALNSKQVPSLPPMPEQFHREHMRLLTDTLSKKVDDLEAEIAEHKHAKEALQESEQHYRQIIETSQEGVWTLDADNRTTLANQRLADLLGYSIEEMNGKSVFDFMDEEAKAIATKSLKLREQGINEQLDFKYVRKDGSPLWVLMETSTLTDKEGKYIGALAMLTDITERKRSEEKIHRQLEHLTALTEIDRAISAGFDIQLSLATLLAHVIAQLGVNAADVLLFDPASQTLEYAAGQGFQTQPDANLHIHLGKGHAAHAVLNRRLLHIPNLKEQQDDPLREAFFASEGFVDYYAVPLLAKGQINGVLEIFRRTAFEADQEWLDFLKTLAGQAAIAIDNATLFDNLQRSNMELMLAYDATIEGWSHALDLRDKETEGHTQRVTELTLKLAQSFNLSQDELVQVRWGALLHDIGKMGVPDGILLKPGPLTEEEWVIMKKHPTFAYEMLSPIRYLHSALDIPYCHHEKWDGTGYPRGLKGEQIPLAARIFAVVDVWDALHSDRPYREAWPAEKIREHIRSLSGTHFDPRVATTWLESNMTH